MKSYEVTATITFFMEASGEEVAQKRAEAVMEALVSMTEPKPLPGWWPDIEAPEIEIGEGE